MNILALDVATTTGWAMMENGVLSWGHVDFTPRRGESPGMRFLRFTRWLEEMALDRPLRPSTGLPRVQLIAFERAHHRGGAATHVLVGLMTHVESFCAAHAIQHASATTSELKIHALGRGNGRGGKPAMVAAAEKRLRCEGRGLASLTDDEADALWCLWWALDQIPAQNGPARGKATA